MNKKLICQTGLKKNILTKAVFEQEIKLCQKLNRESSGKGCGWGTIFLLV